ncbi:hypothetical protein ERO13_A06G038000v2 [Gossypium hirsutum]|uniref:Uncharacterized protein n=2 Tax=Gossypium TaxID=3633 RepID=A0A5D2PZZ1_GOSTO|nr:hypothetical protein ERO13_A06G038000v2 [Gossypium hirsutum]TYI21549.1 hypothetical protein ES332_A06G044700v1 [Gossypium tomentosum]
MNGHFSTSQGGVWLILDRCLGSSAVTWTYGDIDCSGKVWPWTALYTYDMGATIKFMDSSVYRLGALFWLLLEINHHQFVFLCSFLATLLLNLWFLTLTVNYIKCD